jgi:hypothetical protein
MEKLILQSRPLPRPRSLSLGAQFACVSCLFLLSSLPLFGQTVLYDNGPDEDDGYYQINFGAATADSFVLSQEATITNVVLTIYAVDDRNDPERLKWTISTEPFGGQILGRGFVLLSRLQAPYETRFLFFGWRMGFPIDHVHLQPGTYWLQIEDVRTRWDTYAFWAQSSGSSQAYHIQVGPSGYAMVAVSESFAVLGEWAVPAQ